MAGGVLRDQAFKLFRGTIDFKAGSAGSEGEEQEDVLILGDDAVNQTIPLILCAEEDVQGSHGATIGRLDDELLFYLCSTGDEPGEGRPGDDPGPSWTRSAAGSEMRPQGGWHRIIWRR